MTTTSGVRRRISSSIAQYSPQDLSGKTKCREDLLASFDIPKADARLPVIGIVSRFASQKGFDLIAQIMERLAREEMIIVALGSGDKTYEEMFLRLSKLFPQKIAVKVAYDNTLAHKIEAGSDMFLMPSKIRALRPEPDLQSEIRDRAHRPRHRRP